MDVFDLLFEIGVLKQLVLSEVIERFGGFFEDLTKAFTGTANAKSSKPNTATN